MYQNIRKIHFVGIGGIGMSGLAEVLINMGYEVSGSDIARSPLTDRLARKGAKIQIGHRPSNIGSAQVVVISSAVRRSNPEVCEAVRREIPVIARAEMLAELMRMKYGVAIAGSHGKTTVTSLIATVLAAGGLDPTMVIGGRLKSLGSNARLGRGEFLVAEADESDGSFLHLTPTIAVVTNIDREHMDHYRDFAALKKTFEEFVGKIPFYGLAVFCTDHPVVSEIAEKFERRQVRYGLQSGEVTAKKIRAADLGSRYEAYYKGKRLGLLSLPHLPGLHNVQNSLAALAVGLELKIPFRTIQKAFASFEGVARRFEIIYPLKPYRKESDRAWPVRFRNRGGSGERRRPPPLKRPIVVDDYGHHPTEIQATLETARHLWKKKKIWAVFQPHRYSRTQDLLDQFATAFDAVDELKVLDIYPAGEEPIHGVNSSLLVKKIANRSDRRKPHVTYEPDRSILLKRLGEIRPEVLITIGAGDVWKIAHEMTGKFNESFK